MRVIRVKLRIIDVGDTWTQDFPLAAGSAGGRDSREYREALRSAQRTCARLIKSGTQKIEVEVTQIEGNTRKLLGHTIITPIRDHLGKIKA